MTDASHPHGGGPGERGEVAQTRANDIRSDKRPILLKWLDEEARMRPQLRRREGKEVEAPTRDDDALGEERGQVDVDEVFVACA